MTGKTSQDKTAELLGTKTIFREERRTYRPELCPALTGGTASTRPLAGFDLQVLKVAREQLPQVSQNALLEIVPAAGQPSEEAPRRLGIVLSGGPAPGGHNVIAGVFEAMKKAHPDSRLIGFLSGPKGIITNKHKEVTREMVDRYLNSSGFYMLGTGRDKIDNPEKMEKCRQTCVDLQLSGLVVVGGDDSNTNAAFLAEHLREAGGPGHRHPQDHRRRPAGAGPPANPLRVPLRLHGLRHPGGEPQFRLHVGPEVLAFHPAHGPQRLPHRPGGGLPDPPQRHSHR